ncbi:replicative DNA helicase [Elusimicrobiota bacterium]
MMNDVRVPPQAVSAEMAVLGSMMLGAEAAEKAVEVLAAADFYTERHRRIFTAAVDLIRRQQAVDFVTVMEALKTGNDLETVGGVAYLTETMDSVAHAGHIDHYVEIVKEKSIIRQIIEGATRVIEDCHKGKGDAGSLLDEAQAKMLSVAQNQGNSSFEHVEPISRKVVAKVGSLAENPSRVTGVASGFTDFDRLTSGFQKENLDIIAARPGQGKTALALNIASNVAMDPSVPRPVGIFSLEMDQEAITARLIASDARVDLQDLATGFFKRSDWQRITTAAARLSEAPIYIDQRGGLTILDVRTRARRLVRELQSKGQELGLLIIDYLQLMRGPSKRLENRQQEVADISRGLKELAKDLQVPVLALSQLNRRVDDRTRSDGRPLLSDLRESGALEQDADLVAFIYREGSYKTDQPGLENAAELIVAKHRNGPVGTVKLVYLKNFTRFENLSRVEEPEEELAAFA